LADPSYTTTEQQWQSTIDIVQKLSTEQGTFKEGHSLVRSVKSHQQVQANQDVDREVYRAVNQDSTEAAYQERNHEVDRMVTEEDFEQQLPSQCQLPMPTD
jgi:hypothetical protein